MTGPGCSAAGTSGEGCDAADLSLPGVQDELVERVLDTGTPVVAGGRVRAALRLGALRRPGGRDRAGLHARGGGRPGARRRCCPARGEPVGQAARPGPRHGRWPAQHLPAAAARVATAKASATSTPRPLFPFGHGLSYTTFEYTDLDVSAAEESAPTAAVEASPSTVRNTGDRAGEEIVQLYLHDVQAQVARPVQAARRIRPGRPRPGRDRPGDVHRARRPHEFTGLDLHRIVEPGRIEVLVGRSAADLPCSASFELVGPLRVVGPDRVLSTPVTVTTHTG